MMRPENMEGLTILVGDCVETMKTLPEKSVQTCVTSPPYFGLRDYGHDGQIGLEPTPDEFVSALVGVFREVRRVLRDDGTVWLNLGDSYSQPGQQMRNRNGVNESFSRPCREAVADEGRKIDTGLGAKQLIGIPWRVAFALQADGWYLRQDLIWHKPNPMPESVRDRCTKSHEYIFLLTKSARYFYDAEAIAEPVIKGAAGSQFSSGKTAKHQLGRASESARIERDTRNRRSVWTVATKPYSGAHFAAFPPDLIEPCILAGSKLGDVVLDPFGGSGTTAGVALKHGRQAVLCELNPEYAALIPDRVFHIHPDVFQRKLFA